MFWKRSLVIGAMSLLAAACGGGGSDTQSGETTSPTVAGSTDAPVETTTTAATPGEPASAGESVAIVTIDGTEYEFGMAGPAATCNPDFFGGFFVVLYTPDLSGVFQFELWNEGAGEGRSNKAGMSIEVDGTEMDLEADPEGQWPAVADGTSFVDSFSYEGNQAEGTISFIDTEVAYNGDLFPLDPVIADFTVTCAAE